MIKTEQITIGNRLFTHTWSDDGRYIIRDDIEYTEAYDPTEFGRTYVEGDIIVESEDESDYEKAGRILMGVEE